VRNDCTERDSLFPALMDDALVDQGRKENREYSASDVDDLFRCACEKKRAEQRFSLLCENILFAHHGGSAPRRRNQPSQIERMECCVVSEFLQAALPQFLVVANRTICGTPALPVVRSFFTPLQAEGLEG
jgi:hypothetical protein